MRPFHCLPIDPNTQAYYRFGERQSLLADQSGNGRSLTAYGAPTLCQQGGQFVRASGQYLARASAYSLSAVGMATLECWCRLDTLPASAEYYGLCGQNYNLRMAIRGITGAPTYQLLVSYEQSSGGTQNVIVAWASLAAATWYHVAATLVPNDRLYVFINGVLVDSSSTTADLLFKYASAELLVGDFQPTGHYFNGVIDEVRLSSAARYTAAFAPRRYAEGRRGVARGPGLEILAGVAA